MLLLIEVADSSLAYDREVKGPIYAEAGVRKYWIVNLMNSTVEVYRDPQSDGRFATVTTAVSGEILTSLLLSALSVPVDEILGLTQSLSGNLRLRQVLNWRRLTAKPIHFPRKGLRDDIRTDSS